MPDSTRMKHLPPPLFADLSAKLAERLGYLDPFDATDAVSLISELRYLHSVGAINSLSLTRWWSSECPLGKWPA